MHILLAPGDEEEMAEGNSTSLWRPQPQGRRQMRCTPGQAQAPGPARKHAFPPCHGLPWSQGLLHLLLNEQVNYTC